MRVHHLNCISTCPLGGKLMDGESTSLRGKLACHCLLLEMNDGLVLVDTGLGLHDVRSPKARLSWFFLALVSPDFREEMTAARQIETMGFSVNDVRTILLTHLDFDHAGGIDDFPQARVHLLAEERAAAFAQRQWLDRQRYRPQQWSTKERWVAHEPDEDGEAWFGFKGVREIEDLHGDVLFVPLFGHTFGHAGIAVRVEDGWLLHAGDAYFYRAEMDLDEPYCTPGLRFYQWMMEKDRAQRLENQRRLRVLKREHPEINVFSAHDTRELERLAGRRLDLPPPIEIPVPQHL